MIDPHHRYRLMGLTHRPHLPRRRRRRDVMLAHRHRRRRYLALGSPEHHFLQPKKRLAYFQCLLGLWFRQSRRPRNRRRRPRRLDHHRSHRQSMLYC